MYDSLGRTQYSCVGVLKGWILERKEIIAKWDDLNVRYVSDKVSNCTYLTVLLRSATIAEWP